MGSKIILPDSFSGDTGKWLRSDVILPKKGAILLIDGAHSAGGFGTGVPAEGAMLPNIGWDQAANMIGSGSQATLSPLFVGGVVGSLTSGTSGVGKERSSKGGLHVASRQDAITANNGRRVIMPSTLKNYIDARIIAGKPIYYSTWVKTTRLNTTGIGDGYVFAGMADVGEGGNRYSLVIKPNGVAPAGGGYSNVRGVGLGATGSTFISAGPIGRTTTWNAGLDEALVAWGATGYGYGGLRSSNPGANRSYILYRLYIEDLEVSGRSYAEVDAIDYAMFQTAFAMGGKFYNDTFTAPAILAGA